MKEPRHINLHLPTSWNTCTTEELEHIAAAIVAAQLRVDRYHPFDWATVKLQIVLGINGMEVVGNEELRMKNEESLGDDTFMVRFSNTEANTSFFTRHSSFDNDPWPISVGQLHALCERLSWLDDPKASKIIFRFPYPELSLELPEKLRNFALQGPPPLLDGYTWREYRWLTDWMQEYMRLGNALAQMKNGELRTKNQASLNNARNEFLAVLFRPKDDSSAVADSSFFEDFSPIKFQVILFWWSSLMEQLAKKFPRVFKPQPVGKGKQPKRDTPFDFYNRVTATVQKYIGGLSASDVDSQPYSVTLQQLEMMADEAAEIERAKSRHS